MTSFASTLTPYICIVATSRGARGLPSVQVSFASSSFGMRDLINLSQKSLYFIPSGVSTRSILSLTRPIIKVGSTKHKFSASSVILLAVSYSLSSKLRLMASKFLPSSLQNLSTLLAKLELLRCENSIFFPPFKTLDISLRINFHRWKL